MEQKGIFGTFEVGQYGGWRCLHLAAHQGARGEEALRLLLELGASPNVAESSGSSALGFCSTIQAGRVAGLETTASLHHQGGGNNKGAGPQAMYIEFLPDFLNVRYFANLCQFEYHKECQNVCQIPQIQCPSCPIL